MCLLVALYRRLPGCPLFLLANRDESRSRPTAPPQIVHDDVAWLGGIDRQAGGTWLGINRYGLTVTVTNRRRRHTPSNPRSRGLLCRDLLGCRRPEDALQQLQKQRQKYDYDGFNLLVFGWETAYVIEQTDEMTVHSLEPGLHVIANGGLNDPQDPRVCRAQRELADWPLDETDLSVNLEAAEEVSSLPAEGDLPGICLEGPDWGTVSATVLAVPENLSLATCQYAPGPPGQTPWEDYSAALRNLLTQPEPDAVP